MRIEQRCTWHLMSTFDNVFNLKWQFKYIFAMKQYTSSALKLFNFTFNKTTQLSKFNLNKQNSFFCANYCKSEQFLRSVVFAQELLFARSFSRMEAVYQNWNFGAGYSLREIGFLQKFNCYFWFFKNFSPPKMQNFITNKIIPLKILRRRTIVFDYLWFCSNWNNRKPMHKSFDSYRLQPVLYYLKLHRVPKKKNLILLVKLFRKTLGSTKSMQCWLY